MRLLFRGSCPKNTLGTDINEDRWAFDEAKGTLALCDGASESFDSDIWAQILANKFITQPEVTPEWIAEGLSDYVSRHDFPAMTWSRLASYERGTFSTLLGVKHILSNETVEVLAVGDSLAVLADEEDIVFSWPYSDPDRFQDRPTLLATLPEHNGFVSGATFWETHGNHYDLSNLKNPRLICMTDALGEWMLRQASAGGNSVARLLSLRSEEELVALVTEERQAGRMRIDDSTLLVAGFDEEE